MRNVKILAVMIGKRKVGTLAETPEHLVAFEYDADWLREGGSISPISLPLQKGYLFQRATILLRAYLGYLQTVCRMDGADCWWTECFGRKGLIRPRWML